MKWQKRGERYTTHAHLTAKACAAYYGDDAGHTATRGEWLCSSLDFVKQRDGGGWLVVASAVNGFGSRWLARLPEIEGTITDMLGEHERGEIAHELEMRSDEKRTIGPMNARRVA